MPDVSIRDLDDTFDDEIEPELLEIVRPIVAKWEAAILKVGTAPMLSSPGGLPVAADSPEQLLLRRFIKLSETSRLRSAERSTGLRRVNRFRGD